MPDAAPRRLPWFIRFGDRITGRYERWATGLLDAPEFHEQLLLYAATRDEEARAWLAEALSRYDFVRASRWWMTYAILLLTLGAAVALPYGVRGCGVLFVLLLLAAPLHRFDRWNRRRTAWRALGEGRPSIHEKVEVKPPAAGSTVFQSYWSAAGRGLVELDHPIDLQHAVASSNEWWQWTMPVPHDRNGRLHWSTVHYDVGLVHRDADGHRHLLAAGVVYLSYDPWTGRVG